MKSIIPLILSWLVMSLLWTGCASLEQGRSSVEMQSVSGMTHINREDIEKSVTQIKAYIDDHRYVEAGSRARAIMMSPFVRWQDVYKVVRVFSSAGRYQHVLNILDQREDLTNTKPPLLLYKCNAYYQFQLYSDAMKACESAEKIGKTFALPIKSPKFFKRILTLKAKVSDQMKETASMRNQARSETY